MDSMYLMNSSLDESVSLGANGLPLKKILKSQKRIFDE